MNIILHIVICCILLLCAIGVGLYRRWLENHCDSLLHLHGDTHDAALVTTQSAMCRRLEVITKIKTALIVAVVLYALAIVAIASYNAWNSPI